MLFLAIPFHRSFWVKLSQLCAYTLLLIFQLLWLNVAFADPVQWRFATVELQPYFMGSSLTDLGRTPDEGQTDPVYISLKGKVSVSVEEVTVEQFSEFISQTGLSISGGCYGINSHNLDAELNWKTPGFPQKPNYPVVCVNWQDAQAFLTWLNKKNNLQAPLQFRLPSDAEWEFLARGTTAPTPWGSSSHTCTYANVADNTSLGNQRSWRNRFPCNDTYPFTAPAKGNFTPNAFGLYHTLGNVWEWTDSIAEVNSSDQAVSSTDNGTKPNFRFLRGGSYLTYPKFVRFANKDKLLESSRSAEVGFRIMRNLP